jgi:hypothetical protein
MGPSTMRAGRVRGKRRKGGAIKAKGSARRPVEKIPTLTLPRAQTLTLTLTPTLTLALTPYANPGPEVAGAEKSPRGSEESGQTREIAGAEECPTGSEVRGQAREVAGTGKSTRHSEESGQASRTANLERSLRGGSERSEQTRDATGTDDTTENEGTKAAEDDVEAGESNKGKRARNLAGAEESESEAGLVTTSGGGTVTP